MDLTLFNWSQNCLLLLGAIAMVTSVLLHLKNKDQKSIIVLCFSSLALGLFSAILDPYLNIWDEQFHALVAKNMANGTFIPMLYPVNVLPYNYQLWIENQVWLHKPPLFLWQMALSIKLFGANEVAIRLPSVLMHALLPYFVYRIGKISFNSQVAFISSVLIIASYFPYALISGIHASDHNDMAFLFYVTASFWAWFEYKENKSLKWLLLISLFSACAILNKWAMGLLVYFLWGISVFISNPKNLIQKKFVKDFSVSIGLCLMLILPWHLYTYITFPQEYSFVSQMNASRLFEAVEGKEGDFFFHFTKGLQVIYGNGDLIPFLLTLGIILFAIKTCKKEYKTFILSAIFLVYFFFSIVATKMVGYTIIAQPFLIIGFALIIDSILEKIHHLHFPKHIFSAICLLFVIIPAFYFFNLEKMQTEHGLIDGDRKAGRDNKLKERKLMKRLEDQIDKDYILLNGNYISFSQISIMFYTDIISYQKAANTENIEILRSKGKKIAILDKGELPDFIREDENIILINKENL